MKRLRRETSPLLPGSLPSLKTWASAAYGQPKSPDNSEEKEEEAAGFFVRALGVSVRDLSFSRVRMSAG